MEKRNQARDRLSTVVDCYLWDRSVRKKVKYEMWTRDVSNSGIGLRWIRQWMCRNCKYLLEEFSNNCKLQNTSYATKVCIYQPKVEVGDRIVVCEYLPEFKVFTGTVIWINQGQDHLDIGVKFN